jgi:hypothetical protein
VPDALMVHPEGAERQSNGVELAQPTQNATKKAFFPNYAKD